VFTGLAGDPMARDRLTGTFKTLAALAGLPPVRLHGRQQYASQDAVCRRRWTATGLNSSAPCRISSRPWPTTARPTKAPGRRSGGEFAVVGMRPYGNRLIGSTCLCLGHRTSSWRREAAGLIGKTLWPDAALYGPTATRNET
jgi:hypothetical protein